MLKKKEKLEQMRELGRGGLSKGLSFLRTAAANASIENGEATTTASSSETQQQQGGTNKMTYEELLALSMKLTRQNKLMKNQYQKNQSKLAAAATSDADAQALRSFLEKEVGLDVAACVKAEDNSSPGGSIDVEALTEKYRILSELKDKEAQETKPQVAVESVNLLDLSPVSTVQKPKGYEDIDLLGDNKIPVEDSQVDEAMKQVERMREQLRQGAEQTQELEKKLQEREEQHEQARRVLLQEKQEVEQQWQQKWDEQSQIVEQLRQRSQENDQEEEMLHLAEMKKALEARIREMSEELDAAAKQRETQQKEATDALEKLVQEKKELVDKLQEAEAAASASTALEKDLNEKMEAALETQRVELEAAKADSARLQEQLEALQTAPSGVSEADVQEKVATALKELQAELEI
eukprot:jgi/Phyca11/562589/estExt2_Genewise1.C_PHYCAscaffold_90659